MQNTAPLWARRLHDSRGRLDVHLQLLAPCYYCCTPNIVEASGEILICHLFDQRTIGKAVIYL